MIDPAVDPDGELEEVERQVMLPGRRRRRALRRHIASGWQLLALCSQTDLEAWFPPKGASAHPLVYRVCRGCEVRRSCLAAALMNVEYGVWAGTTGHDRAGLLRLIRAGVSVESVLELGLGITGHQGDVQESADGHRDAG